MRKLLIPILATLVLPTAVNANWLLEKTLGIYASNMEAQNACRKWVREGGVFYTKHKAASYNGYKAWTAKRYIRGCSPEEETRQWIGIERTNVKKNVTYEPFNLMDPTKRKVVKRFKY
tara:strand:+ start:89 stop:442 length:354 start_codon:yes stop_codon:yes gene_type:complete